MSTPDTAAVETSRVTAGPLLACGVLAGPLFLVSSFAQAFTRDGFDLRRHPFSMLSLGELGWIQIATFVVAGLLFLACAVGMRRVLRSGRGRTWGPILVAVFGLSQIGGGVFVVDPSLGFPVGAAEGPPASISWHGAMHGLAFALGMLSLIAAFVVLARRFFEVGERRWTRYSVATGVLFVVLGGIGAAVGDWRLVAVAILLGWGWASVVAAHLRADV
ncbi:MAG: DUF998 domain-containing protein [Actinomycetota bacterium]|nr:DUF998 domain-containing protein [Actinomycetota bacterium]